MDRLKTFCRRSFLLALVIVPSIFGTAMSANAAEPVYTEAELQQITPSSPNPYIAFLKPGTVPDYDYWDSVIYWKTRNAPANSFATRAPTIIVEEESLLNPNDPNYESNNSVADAQHIGILGTGTTQNVRIESTFRLGTFITTTPTEDDGAMRVPGDQRVNPPKPTKTDVVGGYITSAFATIGDGPHGSTGTGFGDFDYYETGFLVAGLTLEVDIDTIDYGATFDSFLILRNSSGQILDFIDDDPRGLGGYDAYLSYYIETPGVYYISVSSFKDNPYSTFLLTENFPGSPFVSGSGGGYASEGDYAITIRASELDYFTMDLEAGDVLSFGDLSPSSPVLGTALISPLGETLLTSNLNASILYPSSHPYKNPGAVHGSVVVPESGTYAVSMAGSTSADYAVDLHVLRPPIEALPSNQVLYLTMWGRQSISYGGTTTIVENVFTPMTINPSIFDIDGQGGFIDADVLMSPLLNFVAPLFEVEEGEEDDFMRNFIAPSLRSYVQAKLPDVDVRIGPRPTNEPSAAEVLIGGTTFEVGIDTIGIAQSIDPGNFAFGEKAIVLMDDITVNLPAIPFFFIPSPDPDVEEANEARAFADLFFTLVGNIVDHEAGHFFGNFHTENTNAMNNIMDAGGFNNYVRIPGLGPDRTFNTFDDNDPTLGRDIYDLTELFGGVEDTDKTIIYGVGGGRPAPLNLSNLFVDFRFPLNGIGSSALPFNTLQPAFDVIDSGGAVNITSSSGNELFFGANLIDTPMVLKNAQPGYGPVRLGEEQVQYLLKKN